MPDSPPFSGNSMKTCQSVAHLFEIVDKLKKYIMIEASELVNFSAIVEFWQ